MSSRALASAWRNRASVFQEERSFSVSVEVDLSVQAGKRQRDDRYGGIVQMTFHSFLPAPISRAERSWLEARCPHRLEAGVPFRSAPALSGSGFPVFQQA